MKIVAVVLLLIFVGIPWITIAYTRNVLLLWLPGTALTVVGIVSLATFESGGGGPAVFGAGYDRVLAAFALGAGVFWLNVAYFTGVTRRARAAKLDGSR